MSSDISETVVRIRPDLQEVDASMRRLRDLFAELTVAFDAYLAHALDGQAERLDEIIDRANERHDDE